MHKKTWLRIFTTVLVVGMLFGGFAPRGNAAQPAPDGPSQPDIPLAPGGEGVTASPLVKLDSELRTLAEEGGDVEVEVYILAREGADLSPVASVVETRPFPDGTELVVAKVTASQIQKLASHPDVVAAEAFHAIAAPIPISPREDRLSHEEFLQAVQNARADAQALKDRILNQPAPRSAEGTASMPSATASIFSSAAAPAGITSPQDWYGKDVIGAPQAWAKGFTGEGVNLAVVDSGVDFGHPDLEGKQAVFEDGPYAGWPIALDPYSMRNYYYNGYTGWDNYSEGDNYSWYAGVYDVIYCTDHVTQTIYFNGYDYWISSDLVSMSQSGEIRWSVHPDIQLPVFVSDWVPFILIDANEAGVYDTVIADLNFDQWFDQFDDIADVSDPVLSQDLGAYLDAPTLVMTGTQYLPNWWGANGNAPTWWGGPQYAFTTIASMTLPAGTWIYAPNHWTEDGATTLQDGISDVSGGMVYYIADGKLPVPGMDYLYPGVGPASMNPIPLNGQLVAFMLGSYWAGGADHGTLCASAAVSGGEIKDPIGADGEKIQYDPGYSTLLFDDFEAGLVNWTASGLWHSQANSTCIDPAYISPVTAAVFNDETSCDFNFGTVTGELVLNTPITLPVGTSVQFNFWSHEESECGDTGCTWDRRYVDISADGGLTWDTKWGSYELESLEGEWYPVTIDLSPFGGESILIRFRFDSIDSAFNDETGWYVDDVELVTTGAFVKPPSEGSVQGPAPDANIIAIGDNYAVVNGMQGFYDAYTFLAYGVDGEPNSGDEFTDLASLSYGDGSVHNDGWDWESRLLSYYNQHYLPNTTLFASSGNGGPGFGTINSPQGNTVVSVGASTLYGTTDAFGGGIALDQFNDGEVVHFSGRGPDAMGRPDPDVVATGGWGTGNTPVNLSYGYGGDAYPDGGNAWYSWGGTSRSAPEAAGVMATIYQAFEDANGAKPDFETARQIMMSGAQDLNHDVLRQGAGRVNADTATDIAAGLGGVYVTPSLLSAGEYMGTHYESFGNVLFPGDEWTQTFTVNNPGAAAATVALGDEMMLEMEGETLVFNQVVSPYLGTEGPYPATYYYWADYFVGGDPLTTTHGADLAIPVPAGADFMEVELTVPFELFDFCYNDPDPSSICYGGQHRWSLTVFDWSDRNGDGVLWRDNNADGVVSVLAGDEVQVNATGWVTQTELNRFTYAYNQANVQGATVRLGDRDDIDNIVLGLVHSVPNGARGGPDYYQDNPLMVKVVFYEKVDWSIVETSAATLNVPAGSSATFDATFTIPDDPSLYGLHEGAITVGDAIIPTTVNVAVPGDELLFTLGGNEDSGTPYDNSKMGPGYTWSGVLEEGDWRFYYYDAQSGLDQQFLYVRNQWGDTCGNMPTFNETLVWGPNPGDQFSMLEPDKYGPYGMQFSGGTPFANTGDPIGWYAPRVWAGWYDGDGIPQPESRAWASLWDGLNQVQFRNVLMSGKVSCGEGFEATAGVFGVDAPETGVLINTDQESGSFSVDAVSPADGMGFIAYGFHDEQFMVNQDVPQGKHPHEYLPADLMDGWVYTLDLVNTGGIEVNMQGPGSSDVDLYLLYDANNDGLFNFYDNREVAASSTNWGAWEDLGYFGDYDSGYWLRDGKYAVIMYGNYVVPGDQFDIKIATFDGNGLSVEGAVPVDQAKYYHIDLAPGELTPLTVNWEVPGPGLWGGYLRFLQPWEEEPMYYSYYMGSIFVPVFINKEGAQVSIEKEASDLMVEWGDILTYSITVSNLGSEGVWMDMTDVLPEGLEMIESSMSSELLDLIDSDGEDGCFLDYDEFRRMIHYGCYLPYEFDGEVITEDVITFDVRVEGQPGALYLNKADLKYWWGFWDLSAPYSYISDTSYSFVPLQVMLPLVTR